MFNYKTEFKVFFYILGTTMGSLSFQDRLFLVRNYKIKFPLSLRNFELLKGIFLLNSDASKRFSFLFSILELSCLRDKILGTKN